MTKQTDFERITASAIKSGRTMKVEQDPKGKLVTWHEQSPRMVFSHVGDLIETRGINRG